MSKSTTSITFAGKDLERLAIVKKHAECPTTAMAVKRALAFYAYLLEEQFDNKRILLTSDTSGKNVERLRLI
ncbi:hypothetical protein [Sulfidibacter corallicola]|uniref:Uncharacterized protein n=1 Tax=Sulfidibacter corallicola TaxID=2818388 RepID=A0A8A4TGD6_SULCO|nr:hypothetical protein [Sulfidibacter corallicola]QTD48587.1 hypothetical protein J3U87_23650 [Sulfidibacter corallicola]